MYRVLRKYRVGNIFKYVSLPIRDTNCDYKYKKAVNDNKILCNLIRARTNVKEYIMCNDFMFFITLTCNNKKLNRYDLDKFRAFVTQRIRDYRKIYKRPFKYVLIPEKHKKGGWHLHGVFDNSIVDFININHNGYDELSIFNDIGFNSVEVINNKDKISSYITKYITKDFAFREKGKHLYFASRGLLKAALINEVVYNNNYFDNCFFPIKNDFCYLTYSSFDFSLDLNK